MSRRTLYFTIDQLINGLGIKLEEYEYLTEIRKYVVGDNHPIGISLERDERYLSDEKFRPDAKQAYNRNAN